MLTETLTFEVSQDLLASLKVGIRDLFQAMRVLTAITYFQDKKLSLGKAAELAGVNRLAFMDLLAQRGIVVFDYDESVVESELRAVSEWSSSIAPSGCRVGWNFTSSETEGNHRAREAVAR